MPDTSHLERLFLWVADEKTRAGTLDFAWRDQTHVLSSLLSLLGARCEILREARR